MKNLELSLLWLKIDLTGFVVRACVQGINVNIKICFDCLRISSVNIMAAHLFINITSSCSRFRNYLFRAWDCTQA